MSHVDPELLALLALGDGAGTADDRDHLGLCPACREELLRLRRVVDVAVAVGLDTDFRMQAPPDHLWDRVAAELDLEGTAALPLGADPAGSDVQPEAIGASARRPRRVRWRRPVIAAVAAGVILGAGSAVAAEQLATRPAVTTVLGQTTLRALPQFPQWRDASATAVLRQGPLGRTLAITLHAGEAPGFFEVWLLGRDGVKMISLGDLDSARGGQFALPPGANLSFYSRIDISLQPFDGSPLHSRISVVRGALPAG
jgi:Anti-sigma-K factor rskA